MIKQPINNALDKQIAAHIVRTEWQILPETAQEAARRAVLWNLATSLESVVEPGQQILLDYIEANGGNQEATVIGFGNRTTAELAGLANGRAGKAWEHEDKYWVDETIGFAAGCCVVPAALAAAELRGNVNGRELMTAIAIGIDLEARLLRPLGLGFVFGRAAANATFALGNYGAAIAAAKILKLDEMAVLDAIGIAHGSSCGNYAGQAEGRGVSIQNGFSVRNGIAAARLASLGMEGPHAALSGPMGVYAVHFPASKVNDMSQVVDKLGTEFLVSHLGFKGYPCGVVAHPAIDAVIDARRQLDGQSIVAMEFYGPPSLNIMVDPITVKRAPTTATEAQFSIPWAAACAMRDGYFGIEHFDPKALADPELLALAQQVSVQMTEGIEGTGLKVTLRDGTVIEPMVVMAARGHPNNPLPNSDIEDLLRRSAKRIGITDNRVNSALEQLQDLENVADVAEIISLLSGELLTT